MSDAIRVCARSALKPGEAHIAELSRDKHGRPREALLVLDGSGRPRAYLNRCKHLPIPLDCGSRDFFDDETGELICVTHGATYRLEDGVCTFGPCKGDVLDPLTVSERDDAYYVTDPPD